MSDKFLARGIKLDILLQRLIDQAIQGGRVVSMKALVTVLVEDFQDELKRFIHEVDSGLVEFGRISMPTHVLLERRQHAYAEIWVRQAIENFQKSHLPNEIQSELNLRFVATEPHRFTSIPWEQRTDDVSIVALKANGFNLQYIPHSMQTSTLVTVAVTENGLALHYAAPDLLTEAVCMAAVANDGSALEGVPQALRSCHVCMTAINRSGTALQFVPVELQTMQMHEAAIKQDPAAIRYVPTKALTEALCLQAVGKAGTYVGLIPKEFRTHKVCLEAIKNNFMALPYVPSTVLNCDEFRSDLFEACGGKATFRSKLAQTKLRDEVFRKMMERLGFEI